MFGNRCEECGRGTVRETRRKDFQVPFDGILVVVPEAIIGVCDVCGAINYHGREYHRWRELFNKHQSRTGGVLSPADIRAVREALGMTMSDFSALIGTTRQSLHYWEKDGREVPHSRMVDLMLRLLQEGVRRGAVDVVAFLRDTARSAGIDLTVRNTLRHRADHGDGGKPKATGDPGAEAYDEVLAGRSAEPPDGPRLRVASHPGKSA